MIRISAFSDEISADPVEQLDCLQSHGIGFIEFRSIFKTNVMELTPAQHEDFRALLRSRGMGLSAVGSPVGKYPITEPFEPHLEKYRRALDLADFYGTPNIRVFSYYMPAGEDPAQYRDEVLKRMAAKAELARERGIRLMLENEKGIYADTAERVADVLESVGSDALAHAFDPANYVEIGQSIDAAWDRLRPFVKHFHVKDYDQKLGRNVPAGQGDGQIPRLIAEAVAGGFDGFCVLEPHLVVAEKSYGYTGPEQFGVAAVALKSALNDRQLAFA